MSCSVFMSQFFSGILLSRGNSPFMTSVSSTSQIGVGADINFTGRVAVVVSCKLVWNSSLVFFFAAL